MSLQVATRRALNISPNRIREGLVASYRLGEASGTRFDSVSPGIGAAAQFTAANSEYLSRADNASLSTGDIDFSIAVWAYLDSKPASVMDLFSKWNGTLTPASGEYRVIYNNTPDRFQFSVNSDGATQTLLSADALGSPATATWYLIVVWHDSIANTINIQVNNGAVNSAAYSAGIYAGAADFEIGAVTGGTAEFLDGRIQCVGFWKKVLSADERTALYNAGRGLAYRDLGGTLTTSLTSWWDLSEPAGTRKDSVVASANDLTDNNTVTQAVGIAGGNSLGAGAAPGNAAGKIGNAVQLVAASSQYLSAPDNADLSMGDIDFTIAAWVYLDSKAAAGNIVGKWETGTFEYTLLYNQTADRFRWAVTNDGATPTLLDADNLGSPDLVAWYLIVVWHDSVANTINIQVNNGAVNSAAHTTGVYNGTAPFRLGLSNTAQIDGRIDAVHIWKNRILTAAERAALWGGGNGREFPLGA